MVSQGEAEAEVYLVEVQEEVSLAAAEEEVSQEEVAEEASVEAQEADAINENRNKSNTWHQSDCGNETPARLWCRFRLITSGTLGNQP